MIILFGPSASGKTEVANMLTYKYGIKKVITCTTRNKRVGEEDDIDYYFVTKDQILKEFKEGNLIEMTEYNRNYYGTRKSEVSEDKVLVLDPSGVKSFLKYKKDTDADIVIFFLYASEITRFNRMLIRKDDINIAHQRIENDRTLFNSKTLPQYDYLINTDKITIEDAANQVFLEYMKYLKKV